MRLERARASSTQLRSMMSEPPYVAGAICPPGKRDRDKRNPSQSRLAIPGHKNTLHNGPKVPSPALTLMFLPQHHRILSAPRPAGRKLQDFILLAQSPGHRNVQLDQESAGAGRRGSRQTHSPCASW